MPWVIQTTAAFDRQARKFLKRHPDLRARLADVLVLLERDPFDPVRDKPRPSGRGRIARTA